MNSTPTGKRLLLPLLLLLIAGLVVPAAFAQETTAGVQGTVKDPSGAVVAGATVEVTSPALIGKKTATTDSGGYFRFANLPAGTYSVLVTAANFRSHKQEVSLSTGRLPSLEITLQVGTTSETVEVTGEAPIVEATQSRTQTNVTPEEISKVPKGRSYQTLILFAPGARREPLQAGGSTSANYGYQIDGASDAENSYLVEGMDTGSVYNGRAGVNVPTEFIQEVQVKTSGFEAENGGALGGVVNVIQKRGGSQWHGSFLTYYQSDVFNVAPRAALRNDPTISTCQNLNLNPFNATTNPTGATAACGPSGRNVIRSAPPIQYYQANKDHRRIIEPGFELGGYVLKDRLWLFTSYVPSMDWQGRTVKHNYTPAGATQKITDIRNYAQFIQTHNAYGRVDGKITERIRAYGSWQYAYAKTRGSSQPGEDSAYGQVNSSASTDPGNYRQERGRSNPNAVYSAGADVSISSRAVATARWGYWFSNSKDFGTPSGIRYLFNTASTLVPGAVPQTTSGYSNIAANGKLIRDAFKRKSFSADLAVSARFLGTHNFKFGYSRNNLSDDILGPGSAGGGYDTALVTINWDGSYSGNSEACDLPGKPACKGAFGFYTLSDSGTVGKVESNNNAIYAQDAWTMGALTINYGIRFDKEFLPSFIPGGQDISFDFTDKAAPRIGAAYDVFKNGKLKVYGSFGYFYDIMKYYLPRGSFGGDYWHDCVFQLDTVNYTSIIPVRGSDGHYCPVNSASTVVGTQIDNFNWRSVSNDPNDSLISKNIKPMRQHEYVVGADWALRHDIAFETRYARKRLDRTIEDIGVLGPGVETYYIGNPGEGDVANLLARTVSDGTNTGFTAPPVCPTCQKSPKAVRNYDSVEFRLIKRPSQKWYGSASYTYSRLWGNYSGLSSSDESTRFDAANASRYFDLPHMQFDAYGKPSYGLLPTDRPHTLKLFGSYTARWLGMATSLGVSQQLYSGTPVSTTFPSVSSSSATMFVEGRGNFMKLHRDPATGAIVSDGLQKGKRTPGFSQSDLILTHEIKVSKANEAMRLTFEANIDNLFNQVNVLRYNTNPLNSTNATPLTAAGSTDWMALTTTGFDWVGVMNGTANNTNICTVNQGPNCRAKTFNNGYGQPNLFQNPRTMRFKVKFSF